MTAFTIIAAMLLAFNADSVLAQAVATEDSETQWAVTTDVDDFEGVTRITALSPPALGEPFRRSTIVVRCVDGQKLEAFFSYDYLNRLAGEENSTIKVKFGADKPQTLFVKQGISGKSLFVVTGYVAFETLGVEFSGDYAWDLRRRTPRMFVSMTRDAEQPTLATRFGFHAVGNVTINYSLIGAKTAIDEVLEACPATSDGTE